MAAAPEGYRRVPRVSVPWLALVFLMLMLIWGNSLVPGEGSGGLSLSVVEAAHGLLRSLGLPYEWLTNYIVRKTAHVTEYMALGFAAARAFDPDKTLSRGSVMFTALFCALAPSIDETIQLFVPGRSGQVSDVLLDICGATVGIGLRSAFVYVTRRRGQNFSE